MQDTKVGRIKSITGPPKKWPDATVTKPEVAAQGFTKIWGALTGEGRKSTHLIRSTPCPWEY
jgi:hypothetical protein